MRLGVRGWAKRSQEQFGVADHYGASIAQTELVKAALLHNVVSSIDLFLEPSYKANPTLTPMPLDSISHPARDLLDEFGLERIRLGSLGSLQRTDNSDYIFLANGRNITTHVAVSAALQKGHFASCSILHAVRWDTLNALYGYLYLLAEHYDSLVVTSRAGREAVTQILKECDDLFRFKYNGREFPLHAHGPQIVDIPLAINEGEFYPRPQELCRKALGLEQSKTILLYLGRLSEQFKADLDPLLVVFAKQLRHKDDALLVLAGQDVEEQYTHTLQKTCMRLGLSTKVIFKTNVAPALRPFLYSAADVFISPADNIQETFGLSLLEAMACGLPVIASDWSGYRDIVDQGVTGFLVPTYWSSAQADEVSSFAPLIEGRAVEHNLAQHTIVDTRVLSLCIEQLLASAELRNVMGEAGRKRVLEGHTWRTVIGRFESLWMEQIRTRNTATSRAALNRPVVNLDQVFRHYASNLMTSDVIVSVPDDANSNEMFKQLLSSVPSPFRKALISIFSLCESSPRPFGEVCGPKQCNQDAVLWLLKKGLLQIDSRWT